MSRCAERSDVPAAGTGWPSTAGDFGSCRNFPEAEIKVREFPLVPEERTNDLKGLLAIALALADLSAIKEAEHPQLPV
jgi:hypothetical protein